MHISNQKPTEPADDLHQGGWSIQDDEAGARRPRPMTAVRAPSATKWMTMDDIDDGWFLPEEPVAATAQPAATVDLNAATLEQLCQVPGVGPARAERILELRTARGGFTSVDDLSSVKGIGGKTLEQLRPHFSV